MRPATSSRKGFMAAHSTRRQAAMRAFGTYTTKAPKAQSADFRNEFRVLLCALGAFVVKRSPVQQQHFRREAGAQRDHEAAVSFPGIAAGDDVGQREEDRSAGQIPDVREAGLRPAE